MKPNDIAEINVGIAAKHSLLHGAAIYQPTDVASAQFSLGFSIALRIAVRSNDLSLYMDRTFGMTKRSSFYHKK